MDQIKLFMSKLLSWIDNGKFFIHPMKWLYVVFAYLSFAQALVVIGIVYNWVESILRYMEGWTKFSGYFLFFLFCVLVLVAGLLLYFFWMDRSKKVTRVVNEGDQIVAMPVSAHLLQSFGESYGISIAIVPSLGGVLFYLWSLLTGFTMFSPFGSIEFGDFMKYFLGGLLMLAAFIVVCLLIGYCHILLFHFISESIRCRAQIANDVRDLGDIHRAATLVNESELR